MDGEVLIKAENVSKKFAKSLKKSLYYGVQDVISGITGKAKNNDLRNDEFWAVKDISFEVRRGECLGLIGHNGAGKSTLLKMLNGLIAPDEGTITIKGKIGALIELGAGFNPVLSGRENIYNNGAVIGFTKKEIDDKFDTIVAFAELSEFIDMPVQNYSSGMKVRLGFAVAAQMQPDVLLIDEVLAVGDLGFVLKCFKQIDTILPHTAMIFVSHSMPMVSRICNQIILMEHGNAQFQGIEVGKAIDLYYTRFADNDSNIVFTDNSLRLQSVKLLDIKDCVNGISQINWLDDLKIYFKFKLEKHIERPQFVISIFDKEQRAIAVFKNNDVNDVKIDDMNNNIEFIMTHKNLQLSKGIYSINIFVGKMKTGEPLLRVHGIESFQLIDENEVWPPFLLTATYENC